ncbi:hypothetical protein KQX54_012637 [Cotesia glomerata]|uniref:USP domain-containing protein n=1 Tax=Cotesia glomerata TaxID=32391 RepID=A0AAV7IYX7_COTGL|nr:hypothetical protein KQX54_012637 [Cotesia glomerata]
MCKLRDFPKRINLSEQSLDGEKKQLRYRLSGTIGYQNNNHYVAYCHSLSSSWQFFNDSLPQPRGINSSTDIIPHGVLYILCQNSTNL